jgi:hypothetical protein
VGDDGAFPDEWHQGLLLDYVFLEVTTVLLMRRDIGTAARVGRPLLDSSELDFIPRSDLFHELFESFARQGSTRLSFADVAIAHVAQERAEGLVLTFDEELQRIPGIRVPA